MSGSQLDQLTQIAICFRRTPNHLQRSRCDGCLSSAGVGFWMSLYSWTETGRKICFTCLWIWINSFLTSSRSLYCCSPKERVSLNPNTRPVLSSPKREAFLSSSTTYCPEPRDSRSASNTSKRNVFYINRMIVNEFLLFGHSLDPEAVIYDIQLKFQNDAKHLPTFSSMVRGKQIVGDFYLKKIAIKDVPTDSEEEISNFLYDLYQRKVNTNGMFTMTGHSFLLDSGQTDGISRQKWPLSRNASRETAKSGATHQLDVLVRGSDDLALLHLLQRLYVGESLSHNYDNPYLRVR